MRFFFNIVLYIKLKELKKWETERDCLLLGMKKADKNGHCAPLFYS